MINKAPKHLLNTTEVMTCKSGRETHHVKMLNDPHITVKSLNRILFFHNPELC